MEFEWDDAKRLRTLAERGFDFVTVHRFFDGRPVAITASDRGGEKRFKTTAVIEDVCYPLIWTFRGEAVRVISMRRAHGSEERAYRALHRR